MNSVFNNKTLSIIRKAIGNESYLLNAKVLFSSLIYLKDGNLEDSYIIKKTPNTPKFLEDWIIYLTMRSASRSFLTTAKMIRDEKDVNTYTKLDFFDFEDLERLFYAQKNESDLKKKKNVFLMSKSQTLQDIYDLQFYKEDFAEKHVMLHDNYGKRITELEDEEANKFLGYYNIKIVKDPIKGIDDALNYITEKIADYSPILCEIGPTILLDYITEKNKIDEKVYENFKEKPKKNINLDFVLISAYTGYLSKDCIGPKFPSISQLTNGLNLLFVSDEIPSENGYIKFYTYVKEKNN